MMVSTKKISSKEFERIRRTPSKSYDTNYPITGKSALDLCLDAKNTLPSEYKEFVRDYYNSFAVRSNEKG